MSRATPTIKQLEAFQSAASCANFASAAERLHLSVSSLSKRLAELEQCLGQTLFDRSGHKAVLTASGQQLLPAAQSVLDAMSRLQQSLGEQQGLSGRCRFGVGELSALTWLPAFIARVRQAHPALQLAPYVDVGAVLEQRVDKGELDFAVIAGRSSRHSVLSQPVGSARFAWMAAPEVVGQARELSPALLRRHALITLPSGAGTTRLLDDWLLSHGLSAEEHIECNNWAAIAGMLRQGLGVGILPEGWHQIGPGPARLQVLRSRPALAPLHYAFQWRRGDRRALILSLRDLVAECVDFSGASGIGV